MKKTLFPAKILLFGEYGVLKNSSGLSIPHNIYKGALKLPCKFNKYKKYKDILCSNYQIGKFYDFLSILEKKNEY